MSEGKVIKFGSEAQEGIISGIEKAADAIKVTMGPAGRCVMINQGTLGLDVSRDGATVSKSISFKDQALNMGAQLVRKTSSLTEDQAGDGTSTSAILTKELCLRGKRAVNAGANRNEIKSGMLKAGKRVSEFIAKNSIPVNKDLEKVKQVATVSANNDPEVGELISECFEKIGFDGVITTDMASGLETVIDVSTGMKLDRGWSSPQYADETGICVLDNCYVLVVGEKISSMNQMVNILEQIMTVGGGKPFLIVCDDMEDNVNLGLIYNVRISACKTCVVKGIDFGDSRKNVMQDLATLTGGSYICEENGLTLTNASISDLGVAKKVIISKQDTIIIEGQGKPEEIKTRVEILKSRLEDPSITDYERTKFEKRVANLSGGIGVIKAGGATEVEKLNRKATIEDAVKASKSAISEGYTVGGGTVYLKASQEIKKDSAFWKGLSRDETEGAEIVINSLPVIIKTVVENAGYSSDVIISTLSKSKKENYGFNAKTGKYCNLLESGILDSAKVLRVALENSISTASMVLLTDCTILEDQEETKE